LAISYPRAAQFREQEFMLHPAWGLKVHYFLKQDSQFSSQLAIVIVKSLMALLLRTNHGIFLLKKRQLGFQIIV